MSFLATILSGRARRITHVVGWALVFLTFFYLISGLRGAWEALWRSSVNISFLMTLFYGNARVLVNRFLEKGRYVWWATLTAPFWLGLAALRTWTELHLFGGSLFQRNPGPQNAWVMFLVFTFIYLLLLVFSALYQMLENRYQVELQHRELKVRHAEAQLNYLKAQINPHFLFNTLNNIYAAATLQHPRTADMVLRLSDLLRYVTYDAQKEKVPLTMEVRQLKGYLELYQMKSETPPDIRFELRGDAEAEQIEPMLLLPIVENALKHGDLDNNPAGYIEILLEVSPETLRFRVENTFDPENQQKDSAGGVGLANIRHRLALHHPDKHRLEMRHDNHLFTVEMLLEK